ncbi:MAG: 50S ribosomal protein L10 [Thermoplasmata archaeon]|nr:50S ribosomal protein L10 [Thermoplasmata archaeon]MCI4355932.1 50S ribosomal protein L10 [Thermoplasmata archaeon]
MPGRGSVRPEKITEVAALADTIRSHRTTAIIGVRGVPASALQKMRRALRDRGHPIVVSTNSSLRHAIELAAPDRPALKPLLEHVNDQTAVLTAEGNPFSLYQELSRTRSPTPARGGELAPKDIVVPAQTTSFKPGPIVGELQHAGFPAAIEKGKVVLKKDTTVVKAGLPISREVAGLLTRLDIFPLEVGLELRAAVDGDTFYPPSVLAVDLDAQRGEMVRAHRSAISLALELAYATPVTAPLLMARGHRRALALAIAAGYTTPATLQPILAKALAQARALERLVGS